MVARAWETGRQGGSQWLTSASRSPSTGGRGGRPCEPRLTLADFLRERCQLTGTHLGCEHGVCGACTVLLDGQAVRSCLVFAVQADGGEVTTVEGIAAPDGDAVRRAAGVPRAPRAAVRLLHPRLRHLGDRVPARQPQTRRTRRSATACPATCAAAPATRASWPPSARRPPSTINARRRGNRACQEESKARSPSSPAPAAARAAATRCGWPQEGADIIAIDICHDVEGALPMATPDDLAETVKLVEAQDRRIIATQADVRDFDALKAAVDAGVAELGRLDIVVANAGIASIGGTVQDMSAGQLAEHHRHQPDRPVEHRPGGHPAPDRGRPGRRDRAHQLRRRHAGDAGHEPLRLGQARRHRPDADARGGTRPAQHPGQLGPPDQREHADVHERGRVQAVPPRPGEPDRGRRGRRSSRSSCTCCRTAGSSRRTSATRSCSWSPTRPATSPACRSPVDLGALLK